MLKPSLDDALFCAMCLAALGANALIFHGRATVYSEGDPDVMAEAKRIVRAFVLYPTGLLAFGLLGTSLGWAGPIWTLVVLTTGAGAVRGR